MIKKLPSVRQTSTSLKLIKPIQIKANFFSNSSYINNNSYTSQADQFN